MKSRTIIFLSFLILLGVAGCKKEPQIPSNKIEAKDSARVEMIKLNELLTKVEAEELQAYVDSSSVKWTFDSLGFWYAIVSRNGQKSIKRDAKIIAAYSLETMSGDSCYSYKGNKERTIIVGSAGYERGFHYGLMLLHEGDSALFLVPSHLGFGMLGDRDKIAPRASLLYRVSSVQLKK